MAAHDGGSSQCLTKHERRHATIGTKKKRVHRGTLYVSYDGDATRFLEKRIV